MKTPPLLLGAALLFWGWQTDFLGVAALLATILEGSRVIRTRWEFSDEDFGRIWTVCTLLFLGAAVYAFTNNGGPSHFSDLFDNPTPATQTGATNASARTASAMLRWLPMVYFLFMAAQCYSVREQIPLTTISIFLRRRWKQAEMAGRPIPRIRSINVSYPYFAVCLFAASVHAGTGNTYFWGLCALLGWALWVNRPRRFSPVVWAGALSLALLLGYYGQHGIGQLQAYIQNVNAQWLEQFLRRRASDPDLNKTEIGRIGRLKLSGTIVVRIEPRDGSAPPQYLRESSYRIFVSPVWRSGVFKEAFENLSEVPPNSGNWPLVPKVVSGRAMIACYLEGDSRDNPGARVGLLPLPTGVSRVERTTAYGLKNNKLGAVLAEGPKLVMFEALYGPGKTFDSPPAVAETNSDLTVPPKEIPALEQIIAEMQLKEKAPEEQLAVVQRFFSEKFTYSTWQSRRRTADTNRTELARFLLETRQGHCEYFATATVLLLRQLGIPARYATGYSVHEKSGDGYVVRLRDAHAWCLVWNPIAQAWQDFDTTPATWIEEESKAASVFEIFSDTWSWIGYQIARFRSGQADVRPYLVVIMAAMLAFLLYKIFFKRKRSRNRATGSDPSAAWPGLDSEFYLVERELARQGLPRRSSEPLSAWLQRACADPRLAHAGASLQNLLRLHYRYRFDPRPLSEREREELRRNAKQCLNDLARVELAEH